MDIFCAWCGKYMGQKDGEGIEGESHSVCEVCYQKLLIAAKVDSEKISRKDRRIDSKRVLKKEQSQI